MMGVSIEPNAARDGAADELGLSLDRVEAALRRNQVPAEIYGDAAIFEGEMRQIFAKNWVFVAHESEIKNSGDFVLRKIGLDEVIVTRDSCGQINILSNHCRHRGARLCHVDQGNTTRFRCPYHGWIYQNTGAWSSAPHMGDAYGGKLNAAEWGLLKAPKVGMHQGFIFACLSDRVKSFEDYLAGAGWMLDMLTGIGAGGMRVAAPPERFRIHADWKNGAENFSGDVYHVDVAHYSAVLTKLAPDLSQSMKNTWRMDLGSGHNFVSQGMEALFGPMGRFWGYSPSHQARFDFSGLDQCQRDIVASRPPTVGNIFPNLRFIRFPGPVTPGSFDLAVYTSFAQWQPVAPGVMDVWNWMFVWEFETEEEARKSYEAGQFAFGSAGVIEPDDIAIWEGIAAAAKSPWNREVGLTYQYHTGAADRFVDPAPDFHVRGPVTVERNAFNESFMLSFWREWLAQMRGVRTVQATAQQMVE